MIVNFYSAHTFKAHCMTHPIRAFSKQLQDLSIKVKFFYKLNPALSECDILCICPEILKQNYFNRNPPALYPMLENLRKKVKTIIWFDMSDGTGTTLFSVLPYVDLYAKNQLLKDRSLYTQQFYGNRIFSDYYHKRYGIKDSTKIDNKSSISSHEIKKLSVSWNIGLGDYHTFSNIPRRIRIFYPYTNYDFKITPANLFRPIDISYRVSLKYHLNTVSFQREETRRQLNSLLKEKKYNAFIEGKLPYSKYKQEIIQSKILPSPFGLGEICFRDFECFLAGAALIKPDMSHLETWPNYYQPGITYLQHSWDFSDFQEKINFLLENPKICFDIAKVGQEFYLNTISSIGGESFSKQFFSLLNKANNYSKN